MDGFDLPIGGSLVDFLIDPFLEGNFLTGIARLLLSPLYVILLAFGPLFLFFA